MSNSTDLYWGGTYVNGRWMDRKNLTDNINYIDISIYVPQKKILFTDKTIENILAEGELLDMSDNIEEPIFQTESKNKKKRTREE